MRTWEEKVKYTFGNITDMEGVYEVNVPGVPDDDATSVEDGFHFMQRCVPYILMRTDNYQTTCD